MSNLTLGYPVRKQDATTTCDKAPIQHKNPAGLKEKTCLQVYSVPAARSDITRPAAASINLAYVTTDKSAEIQPWAHT